jgi:hypothetical protein
VAVNEGAVVLGAAVQQLAANPLELMLHFGIVGEVQVPEVIDETDQPVEGLLVDPVGLASAHAGQHFLAELAV